VAEVVESDPRRAGPGRLRWSVLENRSGCSGEPSGTSTPRLAVDVG
jgi:hypothetical protein